LLDESPNEKAGDHSAGAGRQHNGRLGKVEMSQVGVFVAFYKERVWTWVDGELFLPEHWFTAAMAPLRKRLGIPDTRTFATKIELGWQLIQRVKEHGLPFAAVACQRFTIKSPPQLGPYPLHTSCRSHCQGFELRDLQNC
jgi:SRSO17 transposase